MDKLKLALSAAALIAASVAAADADAHGRRHHHHHHRSHVGIWFGVPGPFYAYPRYYPRYYYPPAVVVPAPAPPVYIERPQVEAPPSPTADSGAYWYYCRDTQTYYPYVQQCALPWERVTPQGAPPS